MRKPLHHMDILVLVWYNYETEKCPFTEAPYYHNSIGMLLEFELLFIHHEHGYMATAKGAALVKNFENVDEPKQYWK